MECFKKNDSVTAIKNANGFGIQLDGDLIQNTGLYLMVFMTMELMYCWWKQKSKVYQVNDTITSLGAGLTDASLRALSQTLEFQLYSWLHTNYRLIDYPGNNLAAVILSMIAVDFGFYWFHRACHECHVLWAVHQVHHSSQHFNVAVAARHSFLDRHVALLCYTPTALLLPPAVHFTHIHLNTIYQICTHSEIIGPLGPIEWAFVTPTHHKVHHGRNPYCINRNYGGALIVWDRLFGTFVPHRDGEPPVFGLVHSVDSFQPFYCQTVGFKRALYDKPSMFNCWSQKLEAVFRCPSWMPHLKFTSYEEILPKIVYPVNRRDVETPSWLKQYIVAHFLLCVLLYFSASFPSQGMGMVFNVKLSLHLMLFSVIMLESFGYLFEQKPYANLIEFGRCLTVYFSNTLGFWKPSEFPDLLYIVNSLYCISCIMWVTMFLFKSNLNIDSRKQK